MYHKKNSKPAIKETPAKDPTTTPAIPPPERVFLLSPLDLLLFEDDVDDDVGLEVDDSSSCLVDEGAIVLVTSNTSCRSEPVTVDTMVVGDADVSSAVSAVSVMLESWVGLEVLEVLDVFEVDEVVALVLEVLELESSVDVVLVVGSELEEDDVDGDVGSTASLTYAKKYPSPPQFS